MSRIAASLLASTLLLALPGLAPAQQPGMGGMEEMMKRFQDPAAMQRMAAEAEKAQQCMEKIDRSELDALQKRAEAASNEIDRLCKAGKKDEALAKGLSLYREFRSNATINQMRECTKGMATMFGNMPWAEMPGVKDEPDPTKKDICS